MAHFRKSILQVGTYHSPDGVVHVTPDRLRHWEKQHQRLRRSNRVVPVDWDHEEHPEKAVPLSREQYDRRRSAKNTVGELQSIKVSADGQRAEIVLRLEDEQAEQRAKANTVFVSPVIFDEWRDGRNQVYRDVITHVDMVNHPVDDSQTPFEQCQPGYVACAIRMALSKNCYRMETKVVDDNDADDLDDLGGEMGEGMDDMPGDDMDADDSMAMGDDDLLGPDAEASGGLTQQVIANLQAAGIAPPEGVDAETDPAGFLLQLSAALRQKKMSEDGAESFGGDLDEGDDLGLDDSSGGDMAGQTQPGAAPGGDGVSVVAPEYAAMSLQLKALQAEGDKRTRLSLQKRLNRCLKLGQVDPPTHKQLASKLSGVRMSLNSKGEVSKSELERRVEWHESLPRGAYWPAQQRLGLDGAEVVQPDVTGVVSKAEAKKAVDEWTAKHPGMYKTAQ